MPDDSPAGSAARKPKRNFFKKPSWATKKDDASKDDEDPTSMFDGASSTFTAIMAEQGRNREKRLAEREKPEPVKEVQRESHDHKRRRISREAEDSDEERSWTKAELSGRNKKQSGSPRQRVHIEDCSPSPPPRTPSKSLSARYEDIAREPKQPPKDAIVVDLGDSSEDDTPLPVRPPGQKAESLQKDEDDDIDESDPEIREMIRESRRKRRLAEQTRATQRTPPLNAARLGLTPGTDPNTPQAAHGAADPNIHIFINPRIPGTKALIVTRRFSQRMQEVREAWCKKQGFNEEMSEAVFFTFRGIRLYDVATGRSLGLSVDSEGNLMMKGRQDAFDDGEGKVEVEAWTQELFDQEKKAALQITASPEPGEDEPPEEKKDAIKVVIKSREYAECKLVVRSNTSFERIANAYHTRMHLAEDLKGRFYLAFDGERLAPKSTMADLDDFEDGDSLEVFFES